MKKTLFTLLMLVLAITGLHAQDLQIYKSDGAIVSISVNTIDSITYSNAVHCSGSPTTIVDITNPTTGKIWMDRNLGASRAATSSTDAQAYGDLYQWGRFSDGHQCRNSGTTSTISSSHNPGHGSFILAPSDWHTPIYDYFWRGVSSSNNPCPIGYRPPTEAEWETERQSWCCSNAFGAFNSPLKLPVAGFRFRSGNLISVGSNGYYWSVSSNNSLAQCQIIYSGNAGMSGHFRANGLSVRCIKD